MGSGTAVTVGAGPTLGNGVAVGCSASHAKTKSIADNAVIAMPAMGLARRLEVCVFESMMEDRSR